MPSLSKFYSRRIPTGGIYGCVFPSLPGHCFQQFGIQQNTVVSLETYNSLEVELEAQQADCLAAKKSLLAAQRQLRAATIEVANLRARVDE
eukprot:1934872-Pyramimonas_sp.AAC.2